MGDERAGEGAADFDARLLPRLRAIPFFRLATDIEVQQSYQAYVTKQFERLCDVWCAVAQPTRAALPGVTGRAYARAGWAPRSVSAQAFLASVRAVLAAGRQFRATLSPAVRQTLEQDFPWLERRHEHIPPGWTPALGFPAEFSAFIDVPSLDQARARWQLVAALNEVQQAHYSAYAAELFRLPALHLHAARERDLALNYLRHWAPAATETLWRQCIYILDGLNATVFDMMCRTQRGPMIGRSILGAITSGGEWRAFVDGLERPQWLLNVIPPG